MAYTVVDDPSAYFQTMLYVGSAGGSDPADGSTASFTFDGNSNLQPDWMWFKGRNYANDWTSYDSTLGFGSNGDEENGALYPSTTGAEGASQNHASYGYVKSFDTDGFTGESGSIGAASRAVWGYASQALAYGWKANGGSTTSVSESGSGNGGINACTHQANNTSGFSIIKYTGHRGTGIGDNNHTNVTHGLNTAPTFVIIKNITTGHTRPWVVMGTELAEYSGAFANRHLKIHDNSARDGGDYVSNVAPDSNYVYVGNNDDVNADGHEFMMYAFHDVQGFSSFGIYEGNGNVPNGTFIYTGFKPRFVLIKNLDAVEPWILFDTKRDPFNLATTKLSPETHQTENAVTGQGDAAYNNIDIYSNGFKCKSNNGASNGADKTIMYMTFAEEPFVTSGGVPATAR